MRKKYKTKSDKNTAEATTPLVTSFPLPLKYSFQRFLSPRLTGSRCVTHPV
ncbi:MAG: hypothetical protein ACTSPV_15745 [Candidatus Hodarchaeales archaeon]